MYLTYLLYFAGCHSNMESISKTIDCYAERSQLQQGAWADKVFASSNLGSDEERQRAKGKGVIEPSKENALPYPTCSIIIRDQSEEESQKINVHNSGNTSLSFFEGTRQTPLTQKKDALGGLGMDNYHEKLFTIWMCSCAWFLLFAKVINGGITLI